MPCPHCGNALSAQALFCGGCGVSLTTEAAPAQPVALSPAPLVATGGRRRTPRRPWLLAVTAVLVALLAGGVVGARMLTLTVVAAHGPITDLLPASTVLYASANLNPDGSQGTNLQTLTAAFTRQPGFAKIRRLVAQQTDAHPARSGCKAQAPLSWDGLLHTWIDGKVAIAVTDPSVLSSGAMGNQRAAEDGVVAIVGLQVKLTLSDIFSHFQLGTAVQSSSYDGVTIYSLRSDPACGILSGATGATGATAAKATGYAAVLNGYAVVGASAVAVRREIDVYHRKLPRLSDSQSFKRLAHAIAADGLAFVYLDTPALLRNLPSGSPYLATLPTSLRGVGTDPRYAGARNALGPSGIAISAQPTGFDLQAVQLSNAPLSSLPYTTPNAAASALPDGTIFYLSLDNLKALYGSMATQLRNDRLVDAHALAQTTAQLGDALTLLDGEYAFGLLPTEMNAASHLSGDNTTALPLVAMIDVSAHPDAPAVVRRLLARMDSGPTPLGLLPTRSAHGNPIYAAPAGYGYALIGHWLVVSTAIARVTASIEAVRYDGTPSLAGGATYALLRPVLADKPVEVMLLDLASLRTSLEALLPRGSASSRDQYQTWRPILLPIRALAFTATSDAARRTERGDVFLAIAR